MPKFEVGIWNLLKVYIVSRLLKRLSDLYFFRRPRLFSEKSLQPGLGLSLSIALRAQTYSCKAWLGPAHFHPWLYDVFVHTYAYKHICMSAKQEQEYSFYLGQLKSWGPLDINNAYECTKIKYTNAFEQLKRKE